ncbi:MAG: glycosyltransferase family 4 protein [Bryobacteraceae bacterium]|nr:glycosyltransferase family 4 protein [Bryobacteraceae bacterium]
MNLFLNQFFYPDSAATSQFLTDLVVELVDREAPVKVIAAASEYADAERGEEIRVETVRTPAFPYSRGIISRLGSYLTYLAGAAYHTLSTPQPRLVLTMTTPPGLAVIGYLAKRFRGARHISWEMDVYPDVAIDLGVVSKNGLLARITRKVLDHALRSADAVIVLGPCMKRRLIARGIPEDRIHIVHNWADSSLIKPRPFPDGPLTILYSGNLGRAHDVATVQDVLGVTPCRWVFAGGGPRRKALEKYCREAMISNVEFRGYSALDKLGASLAECHIGLVTQKLETCGSVVPSKTYGIMAAGRPILYIGSRYATVADLIREHRCGWQVDPGDTYALRHLIEHLDRHRDEVFEAGERAREALVRYYDKPIALAQLCEVLGVPAPAVKKAYTRATA